MSDNRYSVHCDCGAVELELRGDPIVRAFCHCQDCRDLLDLPFNAITAWEAERVVLLKGEGDLLVYPYPGKQMIRYHCRHCGELVFNTNKYHWRLVSQNLIRKCHGDRLPPELRSDKHFYYDERVIDIRDPLPKYLQGVDGPLYDGEDLLV